MSGGGDDDGGGFEYCSVAREVLERMHLHFVASRRRFGESIVARAIDARRPTSRDVYFSRLCEGKIAMVRRRVDVGLG